MDDRVARAEHYHSPASYDDDPSIGFYPMKPLPDRAKPSPIISRGVPMAMIPLPALGFRTIRLEPRKSRTRPSEPALYRLWCLAYGLNPLKSRPSPPRPVKKPRGERRRSWPFQPHRPNPITARPPTGRDTLTGAWRSGCRGPNENLP